MALTQPKAQTIGDAAQTQAAHSLTVQSENMAQPWNQMRDSSITEVSLQPKEIPPSIFIEIFYRLRSSFF